MKLKKHIAVFRRTGSRPTKHQSFKLSLTAGQSSSPTYARIPLKVEPYKGNYLALGNPILKHSF